MAANNVPELPDNFNELDHEEQVELLLNQGEFLFYQAMEEEGEPVDIPPPNHEVMAEVLLMNYLLQQHPPEEGVDEEEVLERLLQEEEEELERERKRAIDACVSCKVQAGKRRRDEDPDPPTGGSAPLFVF